jgi:hypothetical protein
MSDFEGALRSKHMKADVDEYLKVIELTYADTLFCPKLSFHGFVDFLLLLCRDQMALPF